MANGLNVIAVPVEQAPILSLEMIWRAGRPYETQRMLAEATNALITEGTERHTAAELEALFEHHGTSLQAPEEYDTANLRLATTLRQSEYLLPLFAEVITAPAFGAQSFERYKRRSRQQLREDLRDPDTLAYRLLSEAVLGKENPYGYGDKPEDYDALTPETIRGFHERCYGAANATLLVIGKLTDGILRLIDDTLGHLPTGTAAAPPDYRAPETDAPPEPIRVHRPRAQQSMIRMGRRGIHITDPDYPALVVVETILGGYYGSRLMRNIREEKGLTYGIESELDTFRFDGTLGIAADVANENLDLVRAEIHREIDQLCQDLVPREELDMVRAYLLGALVMDLDGPLAVASRYRSAIVKDYDAAAHLQRMEQTVRNITPREVRQTAQKFFGPKFHEVIVGGTA